MAAAFIHVTSIERALTSGGQAIVMGDIHVTSGVLPGTDISELLGKPSVDM